MNNLVRCAVCAAVAVSAAEFPLHAAYNKQNIPDSSEIRRDLRETWFEAPLDVLRDNRPEIRRNAAGQNFQIRLEETDSTYAIFVAPEIPTPVDVYSDRGKTTEMQNTYPGDASGSWVLVKDKSSDSPVDIRYYFSVDSDIYVQFSPAKKNQQKSSADFIIFGYYAVRSVPVGVPFDYFYSASFADVLQLTKTTLPWAYADKQPGMYQAIKQMAAVIRRRLPDLVYADDAMYDENGDPVFISSGKRREIPAEDAGKLSLSSGGFVKWIGDGIVAPIAGGYLKREPLIVPTTSVDAVGYQGVLSESYNLTFALDWTRNLAAAVLSVESNREYRYPESGVDVTIEPFCGKVQAGSASNTLGYQKDCGYQIEMIRPLLYVLAVKHPGEWYIGAVRETDRTHSPEVQAFNECVAFFPYFDDRGRFACAVFRNCAETDLTTFVRRYRTCFVHLTQVRSEMQFSLQ